MSKRQGEAAGDIGYGAAAGAYEKFHASRPGQFATQRADWEANNVRMFSLPGNRNSTGRSEKATLLLGKQTALFPKADIDPLHTRLRCSPLNQLGEIPPFSARTVSSTPHPSHHIAPRMAWHDIAWHRLLCVCCSAGCPLMYPSTSASLPAGANGGIFALHQSRGAGSGGGSGSGAPRMTAHYAQRGKTRK